MIRIIFLNVATVGLLLLSASSASAIAIFFDPPILAFPLLGETFTIDLRLDTEGETNITSVKQRPSPITTLAKVM